MEENKFQGELVGIQMLRALAAMMVVVHHALEESNGAIGRFSPDWLTIGGAAGVDVFFVISGFIMVYTTAGRRDAGRKSLKFLYRRFLRIYPFYWCCCFAILSLSAFGFMRNLDVSGSSVASSFLLLPNATPIINVSWTLVYEVYFYLLFAAALVLRSTLSSIATTTALISIFYWTSFMWPDGVLRCFFVNPIPFEFCMGLWLAWAAANRSFLIPISVMALPLVLFFVAPLAVERDGTAGLLGIGRVIAWGLPSLFLVAVFLPLRRSDTRLEKFLLTLGDASYALYLTHIFVMIAYAATIKRAPAIS